MEKASVLVIGAGVMGCAVAAAAARRGMKPMIVERGPRIAEGTTTRNSGVIHSGLYYTPGSLKAAACVEGQALLYEWCQRHGVSFRKTGKWVVGGKSEAGELERLLANARACGASGVRMAADGELERELPFARAEIGMFAAETGIIDPFELTLSLQVAAEERGAQFVMNAQVLSIEALAGGGYAVETTRGRLDADAVVNCAGLHADEIARLAGVSKYAIFACRGDYFRVYRGPAVKRLIYPVKRKGAPGLGVHLTLGLDGSVRLGPDAEYVASKVDFSPPDAARMREKVNAFCEAARRFLPELDPEEKDFVLSEDLPGFINLVGIESPGLTASLALARRAVALLR
jgi:L-2-hydroxyglutarate oxidase LhgO